MNSGTLIILTNACLSKILIKKTLKQQKMETYNMLFWAMRSVLQVI